ncbi:helix-turn-helix domain-containing protein [Telluribacter humicola]|uniref:helix-turn-helix domain-containing protein n=1 Tax=Telluribacter humicola TaxID=1720261 RepID=UPI001A97498A|nr:helix-turn-helix domain-containing protein [Telluribacter humicola]
MFVQFYRPCQALQPIVSNYMLMHVHLDRHQPPVVKPYPTNPEQCLFFYARDAVEVFNYALEKEEFSPPSIIVGPQVARVDIKMSHEHLTIKVGFQPGGLFRLLGMPMWQLLDQSVDSHQLLGQEISEINEQLRALNTYPDMIRLIEKFLLKKIALRQSEVHAIDKVAQLMLHSRQYSLDWLADQSCLSPRQFERKFLERVGMSPKLFMRVVRFAQAYRMKDRQPQLDWQDIVYQCGYYDQMHLIRDFKLFAHVTPTGLMKEEERSPVKIFPGNPF